MADQNEKLDRGPLDRSASRVTRSSTFQMAARSSSSGGVPRAGARLGSAAEGRTSLLRARGYEPAVNSSRRTVNEVMVDFDESADRNTIAPDEAGSTLVGQSQEATRDEGCQDAKPRDRDRAAAGLDMGEPIAGSLLQADPCERGIRRGMRTQLVHHPEARSDLLIGTREVDDHDYLRPSNGWRLSCEPQRLRGRPERQRWTPDGTTDRLERAVARQLQRLVGRRSCVPI
jgi:hypothetical protein